MWCFKIFCIVVIGLIPFPVCHCERPCRIFKKDTLEVAGNTFFHLTFTVPKQCYPNNHSRLLSVEMSYTDYSPDTFNLYCQFLSSEVESCTFQSRTENCYCNNSEYIVRVPVRDGLPQAWKAKVSFGDTAEKAVDVLTILRRESTGKTSGNHEDPDITQASENPQRTPSQNHGIQKNSPRARTPGSGRTSDEPGSTPDKGILDTIPDTIFISIAVGASVAIVITIIVVVVMIRKRRRASASLAKESSQEVSQGVNDDAQSGGQHQCQEEASPPSPSADSDYEDGDNGDDDGGDDDNTSYQGLAESYYHVYRKHSPDKESDSASGYLTPVTHERSEMPHEYIEMEPDYVQPDSSADAGSSRSSMYDDIGSE